MNQLIHKIHIRFTENKWAPLLLALLMLLVAGASFRLEIKTEITDLLEGDSPEVLFYKENLRIFPKSNNLVAVITKKDNSIWNPQEAKDLDQWIEEIKSSSSRIEGVVSPFSIRKVKFEADQRRLTFPRLLNMKTNSNLKEWHELLSSYWGPFLFGKDQRSILVDFELSPTTTSLEIENIISKESERFQVLWTGQGVFKELAERGLAKMNMLNILGLVILMLILFVFFSNVKACLFALICVALGILPVFGMMAIFGLPMDLLTSNLFLLLLVATIEDVFLILYFSSTQNLTLTQSLQKLLVPCLFTSLTTAVGFGSLIISEVPSVRRFAVLSGLGAINEWIIVFFVAPKLIKGFRDLRLKMPWRPFSLFHRFEAKWLIPVSIIPILLFPFVIGNLGFNASPFDIFGANHPVMLARKSIKASRKWENSVELVFKSDLSLDEETSILRNVQKLSNVGWIEQPVLLLDEPETKFIPPEIKDLIVSQFKFSGLARKYFSSDNQRGFLYLQETDLNSVAQTKKQIDEICGSKCRLTGELVAFGEYSRLLVKTLAQSFFFSLLLVFLILGFLNWKLKVGKVIQILLSVVWGPSLVILIFYFSQTSITLVNCVLLSTIVGLSGDNAIQFMFNKKEGSLSASVDEVGPATLYLALLLVSICVPFLLSPFGNVQTTGILLMLSVLAISCGDYFILKLLLEFKNLKNWQSQRKK